MTALLDVDGVLLDMNAAVHQFVYEHYGIRTYDTNIVSWEFGYSLGIPKQDNHAMWDHVWNTPLQPYAGAVPFVRRLKELGFKVVGLSSRPAKWAGLKKPDAAQAAALRDFPQLELDNFGLVQGHGQKPEFINNYLSDALFMVEDNPVNAAEIGLETELHSYLLHRPWNEGTISVKYAYHRVYGYEHILGDVEWKLHMDKEGRPGGFGSI